MKVLRRAFHPATLVLATGLSACTLVQGTGPDATTAPTTPDRAPAALVARSYSGQLSVQGTTLPVILSLRARGEVVEEARLSVPELDMEAVGQGRLRDGRLELELEYGDDCRGEARLEGDMADAGHAFQGILVAEDCTGEEEGALVLRLQGG